MTWADILSTMPLVAILRGLPPTDAVAVGRALLKVGLVCLEVPLNGQGALQSIALLRSHFGDAALIGAGTVLTVDDVTAAAAAGARLIISPNCDGEIIRAAKYAGLISLPGFSTPTEAFQAIAAGADALKLFPAGANGAETLGALRAVLPRATPVLPVGGISTANMAAYIAAGADGFGLGASLYRPGLPAARCAALALDFVSAWRASRVSPRPA